VNVHIDGFLIIILFVIKYITPSILQAGPVVIGLLRIQPVMIKLEDTGAHIFCGYVNIDNVFR